MVDRPQVTEAILALLPEISTLNVAGRGAGLYGCHARAWACRAETFVAVRRRTAAGFAAPLQDCFLAGLCRQAGNIVESLMNPPELRGVRILADMANAQLQMLLTYGQVQAFTPGQLILAQGDTAEALFLLLEGKVGAYVRDQHGNEVHLRTTESGGHFGEVGLLEAGRRTASVRALTQCTVFRLDAGAFKQLLKAPDLAVPLLYGLSRSLAIRLADITHRLSELQAHDELWMV